MTALLTNLVASYGYWLIFVLVGVESIGIPVPGESALFAAAVYAGATNRLSIGLVIILAIAGAVVGDNIGFLIGRAGGYHLLRRFGRYVRLDEPKLKVSEYLFRQYGTRMVFFGRFVAVLRIFVAFLAGTNRMPWRRFALTNAASVIIWGTVMGMLGYRLGASFTGPFGIGALIVAGLIALAGTLLVRSNMERWQGEAERSLPGPLDAYRSQERAA